MAGLAPGGRLIVAFSVMADGEDLRVRDGVARLAGPRGLALVAEHRGPTEPIPSVALELRASAHPQG